MLHVVPVLSGGERVHLDAEGHAFLPTVLPGRELGTDAVHLLQRSETLRLLHVLMLRLKERASSSTWMTREAFLAGSQRNSTVFRCRGCEQGSRIPTDNGISANVAHFTKWAGVFYANDVVLLLLGSFVTNVPHMERMSIQSTPFI